MVQLLLDKGADPNETDEDGNSPLHMAFKEGKSDTVRVLLERGADPNKPNEDGNTPLHKAARYGNKEAAQLLLNRGADPHKTNKSGRTPLEYGSGRNVVKIIIQEEQKRMKMGLPFMTFITGMGGSLS